MTLREKLLLAISEHHSGNAKEGGRIADAVLALLSSVVEDEGTVERVARAMWAVDFSADYKPNAPTKAAYVAAARAALRALTEEK